MPDVLCIHDYLGLSWVEPYSNDVKYVVISVIRDLLPRPVLPIEELFVVRQLEQQLRVKFILQIFGEYPGHEVSHVNHARRPPASVEVKALALLLFIQDPVKVAV